MLHPAFVAFVFRDHAAVVKAQETPFLGEESDAPLYVLACAVPRVAVHVFGHVCTGREAKKESIDEAELKTPTVAEIARVHRRVRAKDAEVPFRNKGEAVENRLV